MSKLFLIIGAVVFTAIGSGGTVILGKLMRPKIEIPKCPDCNCPPATSVELQSLSLEDLKKVRGNFTYSPHLSNVMIKIESKDSLLVKSLLKSAK